MAQNKETRKKSIHTGHRQRVKEEFLSRGVEGWQDYRILELLLFYAQPQGDVNPLAHELIETFGSLAGVLDALPGIVLQLVLIPVLMAVARKIRFV